MPVAVRLAFAVALAVLPGPDGAAGQQAEAGGTGADFEREARETVAVHLRKENQGRSRLGVSDEPRFRSLVVRHGPRWVVVCGEVDRTGASGGHTRVVHFDTSRQALRDFGKPRAADTHVEDEFGDDQSWREQFGRLWSERRHG